MLLSDLFEANLPMAKIDALAREAITKTATDLIQDTWDHFFKRFNLDPNSPSFGDDRMSLYDEWVQQEIGDSQKEKHFMELICAHISGALTKIGFKVIVAIREFSQDKNARYNGYFAAGHHIMVFVKLDLVRAAVSGMMSQAVFGEGEYADALTDVVAPVFMHEYMHYLQDHNSKVPDSHRKDRGYITYPVKTAYGVFRGPNGGRREPHAGTAGWLRYKSSFKEIEAFATDTASELIADATRYGYEKTVSASQIRDMLESIALGYVSSSSYVSYQAINDARQEYIEQGFSGRELDQTWHQFLKILYQKVMQFMPTHPGKSNSWNSHFINKSPWDWKIFAAQGIHTFIERVGRQVAELIVADAPSYKANVDLLRYNESMTDMVHFIDAYFYTEDEDYHRNDARRDRIGGIVRSYILKLLNRMRPEGDGESSELY